MKTIAFIAIALVACTCQSIFCRMYTRSRRGEGGMQFTAGYAFIVGFLTLIVNGFAFQPSTATLILGLINAAVLTGYNLSMQKAGNMGPFAFMILCVLAGGIIVPLLYDIIFVSHGIATMHLIAVIIMLLAFVIMNLGRMDGATGKYFIFCAALFIINGLYTVLMHRQSSAMRGAEQCEMIITTYMGSFILTAIFASVTKPKAFWTGFKMPWKSVLFFVLSAVSATTSQNLFLNMMSGINLTVLNVTLNGGTLVLSAVASLFVFKEKMSARRILGIVLACVSVVLLSI